MEFALESFEMVRFFLLTALAFVVAMVATPPFLRFLHHYKLGKTIRDKETAPVFVSLHAKKAGTPTMGGILIWGTVLFLILFFFVLSILFPNASISKFNFLSRSETLLPLGALIASAFVGLIDDYLNIRGIGSHAGGLRARYRLMLYFLIACFGAWWFSVKLDWDILHIPFWGDVSLGFFYIPFFILVIVATSFSVNNTDGLDGLAGSSLVTSFGAFAIIAFTQGRYDLAIFCGAILGALLAFLWFNIHPAKFFMGDTGAMSLGVTLGIVALLTNTALLLPIIGIIFVAESASIILQIGFRKQFKRKLFRSAPFHHHLEAIGCPEPQIVMRFWLISMVAAALGVSLALLDALRV
ncbi:phospho-N-acetylmuramoyl-pentapeptide-transferase [Candidatus Uhrbacteria bacterium CG_4_9_14_3_um_filter_36_7]|uniref:Phospho-N-acetylmuramoyl-pentapeptide-transferase n=1 Tax=Candidatus Uhrbacteria bacterium CG_4_9_14_3_um_filter_36_7 TaxID=1975033 RepID=A0A2M7XHF9_9BACT|nr:MAG: phospho-N-acetylmuramoyl-pentapeptide-transferase [Candidatus Uhrbacteria bacterium CG_4_9_14_3_um_filter_36_7]